MRSPQSHPARRAFTLIELMVVIAVIAILLVILVPTISTALAKGKGSKCMQNCRSLATAISAYEADAGNLPPIKWSTDATLKPPVKPSAQNIIGDTKATWWPDLVSNWMDGRDIYNCPVLGASALQAADTCASPRPLGIGLTSTTNIGIWITGGSPPYPFVKSSYITLPADTVFLADAGKVSGADAANSDDWKDIPGTGCAFFRTPNDSKFSSGDSLVVPRHAKHAAVAFADGHGAMVKNSSLGWNKPQGDPAAKWDL